MSDAPIHKQYGDSDPVPRIMMLKADHERIVAQRVREAVAAERERWQTAELEMRFGHGGISCGVVKRGDAFGIILQPIEPVEIGQDLMAKDSPVDPTQPRVFMRFENAKSATVLLECVAVLLGRLCGLPEDNIAAVEAVRKEMP